jgi:uncharacterized protein YegL
MNTEIIAILDASGSMQSLSQNTVNGYNEFINAQKKVEGEARITCVTFDDIIKILYTGKDIQTAWPLRVAEDSYWIGGMTALFDAIGKTINGERQRIDAQGWADNVVVCIITDGAENASKEYTGADVKKLVKDCEDTKKWVFTFLGANIDAFSVATNLGIQGQNVAAYGANDVGTVSSYASFSANTTSIRGMGVSGSNLKSAKDASDLLYDPQNTQNIKKQGK